MLIDSFNQLLDWSKNIINFNYITLSSIFNFILQFIIFNNDKVESLRQEQQQSELISTSTTIINNLIAFSTTTKILESTSSPTTITPTFIPTTSTSTTTSTTILNFFTSLFSDTIPTIIKRYDHANQIKKFTDHQAFVQRVVATSSSCASIASVLIAMLFFIRIDPKRLVFRHHLIFFLLFFDLLKAVILLIYPTRVLTHSTSYYNRKFCQVVGFFTATSIEGADIAILAFALHTYLLIFKPNLNTKILGTNRVEGGLYKLRYLVYSLSFFVPIILASLAFINGVGYDSLVCWCYLPMRPVWYRLVLSWVPRYCIVVLIFAIYGLIYFKVVQEFKLLGGAFTNIHQRNAGHLNNNQPSFWSSLKFFLGNIKDHLFPKMTISSKSIKAIQSRNSSRLHQQQSSSQQSQQPSNLEGGNVTNDNYFVNNQYNFNDDFNDDDDDTGDITESDSGDVDDLEELEIKHFDNTDDINNNLHFQKRQKIIHKQMKKIFVYPFAYCFLWLFPFILQATQFNYEVYHRPIYWLNVLGAFFQPLNGVVDSAVFFYRERPWKYTTSRIRAKELQEKEELDNKYENLKLDTNVNNINNNNNNNNLSPFEQNAAPNNYQNQNYIKNNYTDSIDQPPPTAKTSNTFMGDSNGKSSNNENEDEEEDDDNELDFSQFLKS
ncbi:GPR1 [Candida jiufengensis]|uniref:GPR1 n=1 Tax=Candida jiufengensis TaxID=497108 RepID=UPI002225A7B9|nr:GPR1 [Candida jiufengensis]KAI5956591.1 GPR1 [Candida jiufengensis]